MGCYAVHCGGHDNLGRGWNYRVFASVVDGVMTNKNIRAKFLAVLPFLLLGFGTLAPVAVVAAATLTPATPIPTGTVQATITPYMPDNSACYPTSIIPSVEPFYTPTAIGAATSTPCPGGCAGGHSQNTQTPTVAPTVTVNPSEGIFLWGGCNTGEGITCEELSPNYWHFTQAGGNVNGEVFSRQTVGFNLAFAHQVYMLVHLPATTYTVNNSSAATFPYWLSYAGFIESGGFHVLTSHLGAPTLQSGNPAGNTGQYTGTGEDKYYSFALSVDAGVTAHQVGVYDAITWNGVPVIQKQGYEWWIYLQPIPAPTTPTPGAPTPDCSGYSSGGDVEPGTNYVASLNLPHIEPGACYTIIQAVTLPLPDLSWSPFTLPDAIAIPGWEVCTNYYVMSATFAGVDYITVIASLATVIIMAGIYMSFKNMQ